MLVSTLLKQLKVVYLKHTAFGNNEEFDPIKDEELRTHIDIALEALHTKYWLKSGELIISLSSDLSEYVLHSRHAVSTGQVTPSYIEDGASPFTDDILLIKEVYDEYGNELPINEINNSASVYLKTPLTLLVPNTDDGRQLGIVYQAKPAELDENTLEIELPNTFIPAIANHVLATINQSLGDEGIKRHRAYMSQYEIECHKLESAGAIIAPNYEANFFKESGWV